MCARKAIVAMSGGVDSAVAAYLMKEQGYDCIGVTMQLFHNEQVGVARERSCCSLEDVEDARSVARTVGIPHFVFNFSHRFAEDVMDRFVFAYENGVTPNPCIDCNRYLKFDHLYRRAAELERNYVVTGHYARIETDPVNGRYLLKKAIDPRKDQSYVLYSLTQDQLAHTIFPLGGMTKPEVRLLAERMGLVNAHKKDSQDICFVQNGDYADFICRYTGKTYPEGNFIDSRGIVLGKHRGIIHYTVGQRKGLGLPFGERLYVCEIRPKENAVVVGKEECLYTRQVTVRSLNWIAVSVPERPLRVKVKLRYRQPEAWAVVTPTENDEVHILFDQPQRAAAKGQAAVLYDGDTVVGGGTIV